MKTKICTDVEQSNKFIELGIDVNTADMCYHFIEINKTPLCIRWEKVHDDEKDNSLPAWSLAALFKYLSEIKPQEYTPTLFPTEGKWVLHFVEYGQGIVCAVTCDNPIDACYKMILKLHELNLL